MKKIIVIGSPGAGKTTFAKELSMCTGINLYHLDMIWHRSDRTHIPRDEFDRKLSDIMQTESWIIDGNYQRTMEMRLKNCDTVFLLDFPVEVCIAGAVERVGKKRDDMPWSENELNGEFRQWIVDFPKNTLPQIHALLEKYCDKNIVVFRSREAVAKYMSELNLT